jgi:hypothetical protein
MWMQIAAVGGWLGLSAKGSARAFRACLWQPSGPFTSRKPNANARALISLPRAERQSSTLTRCARQKAQRGYG